MGTEHHALASLRYRSGAGRRAHPSASEGTGAPSSRRLTLPLALLACLLTLAFTAVPASAATGYPQLGQLYGPNVSTHFGQLHSESVAIDNANAHIFVADSSDGLVYDFTSNSDLSPTVWNGSNTPASSFGKGYVAVAADNPTGDVYVADRSHAVIDKFDQSGNLITSFGDTTPSPDGQLSGAATPAGSFNPPGTDGITFGITVDQSTGDFYVLDAGHEVVDVFAPSGTYLRQIKLLVPSPSAISQFADGIAVNDATGSVFISDSGPDLVHEFDSFGNYVKTLDGSNTPPGSFQGGYISVVANSSSGDVYIPHTGSKVVYRFDSSGNLLDENVGAGGGFGSPGVAVDQANGDLYISEGPIVRIFGPAAVSLPDVSTGMASEVASTHATLSGHLDPAGAGEVTDCHFEYGETEAYAEVAPCSPPAPFSSPADITAELTGLRPDTAYHFRLNAANAHGPNLGSDHTFETPGPPTISEESVTNVTKTAATLQAEIDPHGFATTYHFQYVDNENFKSGGFSNPATKETPESASTGEDFSNHSASAPIEALRPETTYDFRVVATNECEPGQQCTVQGEEATFETEPYFRIDSTFATEVFATNATLGAQINPLGEAAAYHFEYLTEEQFLANGESFSGENPPTIVPQPDAAIGPGEEDQAVFQHLHGLQPSTAYRYRVVATNSLSPPAGTPGPDHGFITQATSPFSLPDTRRWELVSPSDKQGATIGSIGEVGVIQAATDGSAVSYFADHPTELEPLGNVTQVQVFSSRTPGGWASHDIATKHDGVAGQSVGQGYEYRFFSADLSLALVEPYGFGFTSLAPEAFPPDTERTVYLRHNGTCESTPATCYMPLLTAAPSYADVPEGTKFGGNPSNNFGVVRFEGATSDLSHVILRSPVALTSVPLPKGVGTALYEWSRSAPPAEALQLVSLLPASEGGIAAFGTLGYGTPGATEKATHAISADGSRVVWTSPKGFGNNTLYLRDTSKGETLRLDLPQPGAGAGEAAAVFQSAAADGSRVLFTDTQQLTPQSSPGPDLYECEIVEEAGKDACNLRDITPSAGQPAEVLAGITGASENDSDVYFVADGVLAANVVENGAGLEQAQHGTCTDQSVQPVGATCNLYHSHAGVLSFIATLSGADSPDWERGTLAGLHSLTSRVTPNGQWLAFMSQRPLTGYDNRDAVSGQRDEEVFLYDAAAEKLICASCNPTAARPHGIEYGKNGSPAEPNLPLVGGDRVWPGTTWLAANVPGWTPLSGRVSLYQSRYLSNSGRLFFNSSDALLPQDSNGTEDIYQYEPVGVGGCTESRPTFGQASDGCLDLISSGTSAKESAFLDASENGDDVFFLTASRLAPADHDTSLDVDDAHVCSSASPCPPPPSAPAPLCEGDACQPPAEAPNEPTPGSLTFHGAGNPVECPRRGASKQSQSASSAQRAKRKQFISGKLKKGGKCVTQKAKKKHKHHKKSNKRHAKFNRRAGR